MLGHVARMANLQVSPGSLFANRFQIDGAAGSGGMGTVYRAIDRYSGDTVALKLMHKDKTLSYESERFVREAQLLSELRHPGIVAHVAHGQTPDGQRFLAMEWLDGHDLSERLLRGPLPIRDCLRLLGQVADALSVAHQRGIIHRDLKPSNLFLVKGDIDRVKILDFGIARRLVSSQAMTKTGIVVGTPEYMAPEQARGSRDLFSIGCVLYECLTGQAPFNADHIGALLARILLEEPIPVEQRRPGVPASLSAFLERLLKKDPSQRIVDAAALRAEISTLGEMPEPALSVTAVSQISRAESFAYQEQSLFSIVLAAPAEEEVGPASMIPGSATQLVKTDRQGLTQALSALGTSDFLANGTLVVTVPPLSSAQDQATLAARAALLIKRLWPQARVALSTGRGVGKGQMAVGEVATRALQLLTERGVPGTRGEQETKEQTRSGVWTDRLSAQLLPPSFKLTGTGEQPLLLAEQEIVDESRVLLGKPTPCVGREAELGTLELHLSACLSEGEFRGALVTGEPGSGKSRLRQEFLHRLTQNHADVRILSGRGELLPAGAPYQILSTALRGFLGLSADRSPADLCEQLETIAADYNTGATSNDAFLILPEFLGELAGRSLPEERYPALRTARQDPSLMQFQLRRTFVSWLGRECQKGPLLFLLDDLHWGDALTMALFDQAMQELSAAPWFVLAFARPEVHTAFPKLWQGRPVHEVAIKGLSRKACERLIQHTLGNNVPAAMVAKLIEQSAGNILFLEELIRATAEGNQDTLPPTVLAMLQARIGCLPLAARRTLRAASVFGQTFWSGGLAAALDTQAEDRLLLDALQVLLTGDLIERQRNSIFPGQAQYRFRHVLMREAAYALLAEPDRVALHRHAGLFLMEQAGVEPKLVAEHLEKGQKRGHRTTRGDGVARFSGHRPSEEVGGADAQESPQTVYRGVQG